MPGTSSIEQTILEHLRTLPLEKQQAVLDFAEFLKQKNLPKQPHYSLKGLWANLDIEITEADIAEARQELWGKFPKEVTL